MSDSLVVVVGDVVSDCRAQESDGADVSMAVRCTRPANSRRAVIKECAWKG